MSLPAWLACVCLLGPCVGVLCAGRLRPPATSIDPAYSPSPPDDVVCSSAMLLVERPGPPTLLEGSSTLSPLRACHPTDVFGVRRVLERGRAETCCRHDPPSFCVLVVGCFFFPSLSPLPTQLPLTPPRRTHHNRPLPSSVALPAPRACDKQASSHDGTTASSARPIIIIISIIRAATSWRALASPPRLHLPLLRHCRGQDGRALRAARQV